MYLLILILYQNVSFQFDTISLKSIEFYMSKKKCYKNHDTKKESRIKMIKRQSKIINKNSIEKNQCIEKL